MTTAIARARASGDARTAAAALLRGARAGLAGARPAFGVVMASTQQPLDELMPLLKEALGAVPLLGLSTAGEFIGEGDVQGGAVLFLVAGDHRAHAAIATGLGANPAATIQRALARVPPRSTALPHRAALLVIDPLAGHGEEVTLLVAAALGGDVQLAGGAAGDDLQMKRPLVGVDAQAASDALALLVIDSAEPLAVGVRHGHKPISPLLKITRAEGNIVYEVDNRPAWDVWAEHTRASAARRGIDIDRLAPHEVGAFLLRYEAGIVVGDTYLMRAPLARGPDGELSFVSAVPRGSVVCITEGDPAGQIASAREAARRARVALGTREAAGALVFDCTCRRLILGDDFATAVQGIAEALDGAPIAGCATYGEIALGPGDLSGFHNTTTVVVAFPR